MAMHALSSVRGCGLAGAANPLGFSLALRASFRRPPLAARTHNWLLAVATHEHLAAVLCFLLARLATRGHWSPCADAEHRGLAIAAFV